MKRCRLISFFIIGLFFWETPVFAQRFSFGQGRSRDAIHFKLIHNLIIIPVYINDRGPFNFILDTGVGPLVITDPSLSDFIESNHFPLFRMRGRGIGPELEAYVVNNLTARVGKASMRQFPGILLKDDPFQLSAYMGMPIHGIMGSAFFTSFIVEVNYISKRLFFYNPERSVRKRGEKLPIQLLRDKPYIKIEINTLDGKTDTLLLLVDSGAGHAVSLDLTSDEDWLKPEKTIVANLGMGLGGPIKGLIGRLQTVRLGTYAFNEVIAAFPEYEDEALRLLMTEKDGSIGGELLKRFIVLFDYSRQEIYLRKNRNYKKSFEHDMSGMEIYSLDEKRKRFFVSRIEPNSPADKAQFLVDDEILSINFKEARGYSLDEINNLLQKESAGVLVFEILRKNQILFKLLSLKRRI